VARLVTPAIVVAVENVVEAFLATYRPDLVSTPHERGLPLRRRSNSAMRKQGSMRCARSKGSRCWMVMMMMSGMLRMRVRIRRFLGLRRDLTTPSDQAGLAIQ
jgi:hypothetical protein